VKIDAQRLPHRWGGQWLVALLMNGHNLGQTYLSEERCIETGGGE